MFNHQTDWLARWAVYTPSKMYLRDYHSGREWSFKEFSNITDRFSSMLISDYGIKKGDRIGVFSRNRIEYFLLFHAAIRTGAIIVPFNFRLTPRELDGLIPDSSPALFFHEAAFTDEVSKLMSLKDVKNKLLIEDISGLLDNRSAPAAEVICESRFDDVMMILYTAGTTGISKGVMITHKMLFWNAVNTTLRLDLNGNDHTQSYAPLFHTGGWNVLFTPFLFNGASHTVLPGFDPGLILKLIEEEKTTIMFGVPTMLQMMSDTEQFDKTDLSSLRYAIVGGAPCPIPMINKWHSRKVWIRQGYGLTEVGPNCFSLHQDDAVRKKGSIGFPNFYIEAKVADHEGNDSGPEKIGELWLKSPVVTPGYWNKPAETADAITEGWFHTGDMVMRDNEGYYYVVDRKKNMFISGGENVYPAEIEAFLYTNKAVKECAVIGVPDEKWGEVGKAFIVLREGESLTADDFRNFCTGNLARYKVPKYFEFSDVLPKNEAGKINKRELIKNH